MEKTTHGCFERESFGEAAKGELLELIRRADAPKATGDDKAALRKAYDAVPGFWQSIGDLANLARARLIDQGVNAKYSTRVAIDRKMDQIRDDLGWAEASQMEQLLIEQVVLCWMRLQLAEMTYTAVLHSPEGCTLTKAEHHERLVSSVQKRYLRAIETLARVRRLLRLPAVQVNIGGQQVIANEVHTHGT